MMCNNRFINNSFNNNANTFEDDFGMTNYSRVPSNLRYGSAYVPVQNFRTVYSPAEGLSYGSMFPELVRPYYPDQSLAEINYLKNYKERGCR